MVKLAVGLRYGHLERRVRHRIWFKLQPVFRPDQPAVFLQALIKRCRGKWRELAEDGQAGRPSANLL